MGLNSVDQYEAELTEFYGISCREKVGKMSAAQILESLFSKYPSRHYIPIEHHITSFISKINGMSSERLVTVVHSGGFLHRLVAAGWVRPTIKR